MSHFKHQHILQLLGVCLDNDPNFILMELMEGGDLLSYLRLNRPLIVSICCIYRKLEIIKSIIKIFSEYK